MCGRLKRSKSEAEYIENFGPGKFPPPSYNVAPTQQVPVLRLADDETTEVASLRWGFVPPWAGSLSVGSRMINAKSETVATKPAFRAAFKARRCLVLADGFYEWQSLPDGSKQAYLIELSTGAPFGFAGIWERWNEVETCTILTTAARAPLAAIHDRMPVIVMPDRYDSWLRTADITPLLPLQDSLLTLRRVSSYVNSPRNDGPQCVEEKP